MAADKQKKELMIAGVLAGAFILLMANSFLSNKGRRPAYPTLEPVALAMSQGMGGGTIGPTLSVPVADIAAPGGGPMQMVPSAGSPTKTETVHKDVLKIPEFLLAKPEVKEEAQERPPEFVLEGISWGDVEPMAIIEGRVVKRKDVIKGASVKDITPQGVVLEYKGTVFTISLKPPEKGDSQER